MRDTSKAVHQVTLANGVAAPTVLRILSADKYPTAIGRQVRAAGIRIYPRGATRAAIVSFPMRVCSRSEPVVIQVAAIRNS